MSGLATAQETEEKTSLVATLDYQWQQMLKNKELMNDPTSSEGDIKEAEAALQKTIEGMAWFMSMFDQPLYGITPEEEETIRELTGTYDTLITAYAAHILNDVNTEESLNGALKLAAPYDHKTKEGSTSHEHNAAPFLIKLCADIIRKNHTPELTEKALNVGFKNIKEIMDGYTDDQLLALGKLKEAFETTTGQQIKDTPEFEAFQNAFAETLENAIQSDGIKYSKEGYENAIALEQSGLTYTEVEQSNTKNMLSKALQWTGVIQKDTRSTALTDYFYEMAQTEAYIQAINQNNDPESNVPQTNIGTKLKSWEIERTWKKADNEAFLQPLLA